MDYEKLGQNRQVEADYIAEEVSIVEEYKYAFDTALLLLLIVMQKGQLLMLKMEGSSSTASGSK